ncbi:type VI secretion system Vgr family protein [Acinetobacter gerneri]|uniref:Type VI secretion system Vgr family protein n=1 Tax=Acinetobacter gerneri TaxID=202952 RepID=A0AAW8JJ06_9GAMM|nr:type VI secretion system Vgr family protein [Acinetobacter gerneri]MDQ9009455.1 type VI secretion system Vgr family protein [Acinetobacter gerneri]MDQ9013560.1 type VI secretion system Vgr family protein [Acinetobacter gerneri]MDQ9024876.1 type VI secretion system Vgr family protein [Acinetobacter gerneri]MDQ9052399.1 type VI secretion system Vgr family protein [Acinetobacter gerneri]MDQ9059876.1 type VI secretion system Vgr family protein [Acinetobacter gerneri]
MLNELLGILDKFGLSAEKRPLSALFSSKELNQKLYAQHFSGRSAVNKSMRAQLLCFSTDSTIPLKRFIACQVAVDQRTDDGRIFRTTGIITEVVQGASDGALTSYLLTIEDPLSLLNHRKNSRVFLNKNEIEVIEILHKEWCQRSRVYAASNQLDLRGLNENYEIKTQITQYNETDFQFFKRLLARISVNFIQKEQQAFVASFSTDIQAKKLSLFDQNQFLNQLSRQNIRFHRSDATERFDSITQISAKRMMQATQVHLQRWRSDFIDQEQTQKTSKHRHSENISNFGSGLELSYAITPASINDLNQKDGADRADILHLEKLAKNQTLMLDQLAKVFVAKSTVRDAEVGCWFELLGYTQIDQHRGADNEYIIISKEFFNQNNLPKDLNHQCLCLVKESNWLDKLVGFNGERQGNILNLQRREVPVLPIYDPILDRPKAHPMHARVTGEQGETVYVDEWSRIKVRYLFSRSEDNVHASNAGSSETDRDSAWVEVLTNFAGKGFGSRYLPRVGELVLLDHIDGDIDRPIVVGRIHESERYPSKFDDKGKLPDTRYLSGVRSQEINASGYNQLRFDDTTGQISAQLQSSHGVSQLNLGKLSHPKEKEESDDRGEGFELRTDQWGAIRAGAGLLLSTYRQDQAKGDHLNAEEAKKQLDHNYDQIKSLDKTAKELESTPLDVLENLKKFIEQLSKEDESKAEAFKSAIVILASPKSIGLSSEEDIHSVAKGFILHSAGKSINISTQNSFLAQASKKLSLLAAREDASFIAGLGKVLIKASSNVLDIIARKDIHMSSKEGKVYVTSPTELILTGGSSQICIKDGGIFSKTGGLYESKAGQHLFKSGEKVNKTEFGNQLYDLKVQLFNQETQQAVPSRKYKMILSDGSVLEGETDENGFTETALSAKQLKIDSIDYSDE